MKRVSLGPSATQRSSWQVSHVAWENVGAPPIARQSEPLVLNITYIIIHSHFSLDWVMALLCLVAFRLKMLGYFANEFDSDLKVLTNCPRVQFPFSKCWGPFHKLCLSIFSFIKDFLSFANNCS